MEPTRQDSLQKAMNKFMENILMGILTEIHQCLVDKVEKSGDIQFVNKHLLIGAKNMLVGPNGCKRGHMEDPHI